MDGIHGFVYQTSDNLEWLPVGGSWAVYHKRAGGLCILDQDAKAILESFSMPTSIGLEDLIGKNTSRRALLVREFVSRGFLARTTGPCAMEVLAQQGEAGEGVKIVQLVVVNACNFDCTYCFEGAQRPPIGGGGLEPVVLHLTPPSDITSATLQDSIYATDRRRTSQRDPSNRFMRPADAISFIEWAIALAKSSGQQELVIQFFGGEPLLNWRAVKAVLQSFGHGAKHGINIVYSIVTNGSLITDEVAEALAHYGVSVCVSFDSPHSENRKLKNGGDSRPIVISGLRRLVDAGNRVALNAALSSDTWEYCDRSIVDFAALMNVREIGIVLDLNPKFYERFEADQIVDRLWDISLYGRKHGVAVTGYWHQIYQLLKDFEAILTRGFKMCSAKGRQLSIEPDGSVFSCKGASGYFGNIKQHATLLHSPTYRQHASLAFSNPAACHGCEIEAFCSGFCLGPLEKKHGRIDTIEDRTCAVYRKITRRLIMGFGVEDTPVLSCSVSGDQTLRN